MILTVRDKDQDKDANGDYPVITDNARLNLILKTIKYDDTYTVTTDAAGKVTYSTTNIVAGTGYSSDDVKDIPMVNTDNFTLNETKSSAGVYYYEYTNDETDNILTDGSTAILFTNIVIPKDFTREEINLLGNYQVIVEAQAIQSSGFANSSEAMTALDTEAENGITAYDSTKDD